MAAARGLDRAALATLARNSFTGSFLPEPEVAAYVERLDAYLATHQ